MGTAAIKFHVQRDLVSTLLIVFGTLLESISAACSSYFSFEIGNVAIGTFAAGCGFERTLAEDTCAIWLGSLGATLRSSSVGEASALQVDTLRFAAFDSSCEIVKQVRIVRPAGLALVHCEGVGKIGWAFLRHWHLCLAPIGSMEFLSTLDTAVMPSCRALPALTSPSDTGRTIIAVLVKVALRARGMKCPAFALDPSNICCRACVLLSCGIGAACKFTMCIVFAVLRLWHACFASTRGTEWA